MTARWERLRPEDTAALLTRFDAPWWIAGGWALDLHLGAQTRPHHDVDVAVLRRDHLVLHGLLADWDLRSATAEGTLVPWDGRPLAPPIHTTPTDETDFDRVVPRLTESARSWLRDALRTSAPQHPWRERLVLSAARPRSRR